MGLVRVLLCVPPRQLYTFSLVLSSVDLFLFFLCMSECFILEVPLLNSRSSDVATKKYG